MNKYKYEIRALLKLVIKKPNQNQKKRKEEKL